MFFLRFSLEDFTDMFGTEDFVRPAGRVLPPRDDLFAGWRDPVTESRGSG